MPNEQINNAADEPLPADARDNETAATIVDDEGDEDAPGGGGLFGSDVASSATGGTAPNAPIDVPLPRGSLDDGMPPSRDTDSRIEASDEAEDGE